MIYVRIELWPRGNSAAARVLNEVLIGNTGGDETTGEYAYMTSKDGGFNVPVAELRGLVPSKNVLRQGEIKGFPRKRLYATDLLLRVLRSAFGDRNP